MLYLVNKILLLKQLILGGKEITVNAELKM